MIKNELQLMLRVERNGVRLLEFHVIVSDRSQPGQFQHGPLARVVSVLVGRVQVSAASVTAELVNGRVIRTVDGAVTVAVLRGKKKTQEHNIKKKNKWGGGEGKKWKRKNVAKVVRIPSGGRSSRRFNRYQRCSLYGVTECRLRQSIKP